MTKTSHIFSKTQPAYIEKKKRYYAKEPKAKQVAVTDSGETSEVM